MAVTVGRNDAFITFVLAIVLLVNFSFFVKVNDKFLSIIGFASGGIVSIILSILIVLLAIVGIYGSW